MSLFDQPISKLDPELIQNEDTMDLFFITKNEKLLKYLKNIGCPLPTRKDKNYDLTVMSVSSSSRLRCVTHFLYMFSLMEGYTFHTIGKLGYFCHRNDLGQLHHFKTLVHYCK